VRRRLTTPCRCSLGSLPPSLRRRSASLRAALQPPLRTCASVRGRRPVTFWVSRSASTSSRADSSLPGRTTAPSSGNPDRPALDVAFAGVVGGAVGPNVNVTTAPLSQFGISVAVDPTDPDSTVLAALGGSTSDSHAGRRCAPSIILLWHLRLLWSDAGGVPSSNARQALPGWASVRECPLTDLAAMEDPCQARPRSAVEARASVRTTIFGIRRGSAAVDSGTSKRRSQR
jgi:hypothetical protein